MVVLTRFVVAVSNICDVFNDPMLIVRTLLSAALFFAGNARHSQQNNDGRLQKPWNSGLPVVSPHPRYQHGTLFTINSMNEHQTIRSFVLWRQARRHTFLV